MPGSRLLFGIIIMSDSGGMSKGAGKYTVLALGLEKFVMTPKCQCFVVEREKGDTEPNFCNTLFLIP